MPTASTSAPLMKMAIVNAQNAGLKIRPICSFVMWNALLIGEAMSPRIANTIDVVTSDTQLTKNNFGLFITVSLPGYERADSHHGTCPLNRELEGVTTSGCGRSGTV